MSEILFMLLGACLALVLAWFFYVAKIREAFKREELNRRELAGKHAKLVAAVRAVHNAAWAPYGMVDAVLETYCNKLWKLVGLNEHGIPQGGP